MLKTITQNNQDIKLKTELTLNSHIVEPTSGEVSQAVIILHGFGADGEDLLPIAKMLAPEVDDTIFYVPDAPEDTSSAIGLQWFDDKNFTFDNREGVGKVAKIIEEYIDQIAKLHNIPHNKIFLTGFSQGAMTALFTAPRLEHQLAGVISMSGFNMWDEELSPVNQEMSDKIGKVQVGNDFPILLIHGTDDNVVPYQSSEDIQTTFKSLEYSDVELHILEVLGHGIDGRVVDLFAKFINRL